MAVHHLQSVGSRKTEIASLFSDLWFKPTHATYQFPTRKIAFVGIAGCKAQVPLESSYDSQTATQYFTNPTDRGYVLSLWLGNQQCSWALHRKGSDMATLRLTKTQLTDLQANRQAATRTLTPLCICSVDPGDQTGVARYTKTGGFVELKTLDFWTCYDYVLKNCEVTSTILVLEQGGLNKPVFNRADDRVIESFIRQGRSITSREKEIARSAQNRAAVNVGQSNEQAELLLKGFRRLGFFVVTVRPQKTKWNRDDLFRYTGWEAPTNQHVRDAMRLAYDKRSLLFAPTIEYKI